MPSNWIKKKDQYPPDWDERVKKFKESKGNMCEMCGVEHGTWRTSKKGEPYTARIAGCHEDHNDRANPDAVLHALCERCHCIYDNAQGEIIHQQIMHSIALGQQGYDEARPWCDLCKGFYLPHDH